MSNYISKKALLEWASNRKSMHRTSMPYDMGIVFMCDSLAAEIISGRFDIPSPADGAAEGRYRFPRLNNHESGWTIRPAYLKRISDQINKMDDEEMIPDDLPSWEQIEMVLLALEALSPIGEQKEDTTCVMCRKREGVNRSTANRWYCEPCTDALPSADKEDTSND